ncbi:MAG TPA: hypothetical protein VJU61_09115, partial [Polyangiaceae bacterium]|nr:hypothetical protein [Polyangiaceae bacterium]
MKPKRCYREALGAATLLLAMASGCGDGKDTTYVESFDPERTPAAALPGTSSPLRPLPVATSPSDVSENPAGSLPLSGEAASVGVAPEPCTSFQVLGPYPGHSSAAARGISGDGRWAIGRSRGEGTDERAVLWDLETGSVSALELLPGGTTGVPNAISRDGRVIVGTAKTSDGRDGAVMWTDRAPPELLTQGQAFAVSADGAVTTGYTTESGYREAFRWSRSDGLTSLGEIDGAPLARGYAVNADGSAIGGDLYTSEPDVYRAVRWTAQAGLELLGGPAGADQSKAAAISADGAVVFGLRSDGLQGAVFRWTVSTGMQSIVPARDTIESAPSANASGDTVVGRSYGQSFVWDGRTGKYELVTDRLGGIVPADWDLSTASGVSDDGRTVVGVGVSASYPL